MIGGIPGANQRGLQGTSTDRIQRVATGCHPVFPGGYIFKSGSGAFPVRPVYGYFLCRAGLIQPEVDEELALFARMPAGAEQLTHLGDRFRAGIIVEVGSHPDNGSKGVPVDSHGGIAVKVEDDRLPTLG